MRILATFSASAFLVAGSPAQTIHLVGPGGLPQIRDAMAIVAPGDIVLVQPGTYAQFDVGVGCTIRAVVPGTVDVRVDPASASCPQCFGAGVTTFAPPLGQAIHVAGLRFRPDLASYGGQFVYAGVSVTSGAVTFDDCSLGAQGSSPLIAPLAISNAAVHLQRCTVDGFPFASSMNTVRATAAVITAVDTSIRSQPGALGGFGIAIELHGSVLHASHVNLVGTSYSVVHSYNSNVWISDSAITSTSSTTCAVLSVGTPPQLDRCTIVQPTGLGCSVFPAATFLLGVTRPAPLQNGAGFALDFTTQPGQWVAVLASPSLATVPLSPWLLQPAWIEPCALLNLGFFVADGAGDVHAAWSIPAGTAFVDLAFWLQGVSGGALPLQLSPVVGGLVR